MGQHTWQAEQGQAGKAGQAGQGQAGQPGQEDRAEAWVDRLGGALNTCRTPRQRDLANTIYERLRAGADVDEVAHLINDLSRTTQRRGER